MTLKGRPTTRYCLASGVRLRCNPVTICTDLPGIFFFFYHFKFKRKSCMLGRLFLRRCTFLAREQHPVVSVTGECQSSYRKVFALHDRLQSATCTHMSANMHEHVNGVRPCDGNKAVVHSRESVHETGPMRTATSLGFLPEMFFFFFFGTSHNIKDLFNFTKSIPSPPLRPTPTPNPQPPSTKYL